MDIKEKILVALGLNKEPVKMAWQAKTEDGTILTSTAEELTAGVDISVLTEDGTTIPLPIGTYKLDTGISFRVEEEGVVGEVMETETEEEVTPKEEMAEEVKEEELSEVKEELGEDRGEDDDEAAVDDWAGMEKRIKNLEDAVADLKREIGETGDVEEMAEETPEDVSDKPKTIKTTEVVEFSVDELKAENEKLKAELAAKPADVALNTNKFSSEKPVLSRKEYRKLSSKERFLHDLNK